MKINNLTKEQLELSDSFLRQVTTLSDEYTKRLYELTDSEINVLFDTLSLYLKTLEQK